MSDTPDGPPRCPWSDAADDPGRAVPAPRAGRARHELQGPAVRPRTVRQRLPLTCASGAWREFLASDAEVFSMAAEVRRDGVLDISGVARSVRLLLDHPADGIRVTALPRDATIEFASLTSGTTKQRTRPARGPDTRDIDFGCAPASLQDRHAPLPGVMVAVVPATDGGTTYLINEPGSSHALRIILGVGAAPRARERLASLHRHAEQAWCLFQKQLRLLRSGLSPVYWRATLAPVAAQLWRALPQPSRARVTAFYTGFGPEPDISQVLEACARSSREVSEVHAVRLMDLLAAALAYWLARSQFEQVPAHYWDRQILEGRPPQPTSTDFMQACQRVLLGYRQETADAPATIRPHAPVLDDVLERRLADPAVDEVELDTGPGRVLHLAPLARDVTLKLLAAHARIEFGELGTGCATIRTGARVRSLSLSARSLGYRLPRHLMSDLQQDAHGDLHATVRDMRGGGCLLLQLCATVAFDTASWHQIRTAADFRLDVSQSSLLEWSHQLACGHPLSHEQDLRLCDHIQEMCPAADRWTLALANALLDEMSTGAPGDSCSPTDFGYTIGMLQRLQLAQVQLYLTGGLLRRLEQDQWRCRIRGHGELASIVERITAVLLDCAWEAMDADLHYQALDVRLQMLERGEPDPLRQRMLRRDRELLAQALALSAGRSGIAGDVRRRLMLKIVLVGFLDGRLFSDDACRRTAFLCRLHNESTGPQRAMNMDDMALIGFLRHVDDTRLPHRVRTPR